jgi:putative sterol carrier protein/putative NADPH-quinone reductase
MKMLAINGSPRGTDSNTDRILLPFLEGAREAGAETETVYLKGKEINYCIGCFTCWTKTPGVCIHKDDMPELLEKMRPADILVYASPLYVYTVTAQMKAFMDRTIPLLSPYIIKRGDQFIHPRRFEDEWPKKVVLISNCGFPESHHFSALEEMFRAFTTGPDTELAAAICCAGGELLRQPPMQEQLKWYIDAARSAGREVVERGSLTSGTQEILDRPLSDPEIYSQMANAYWDSVVVTEPKAEPVAAVEATGTPLPPPTSLDTMRDTVAGMAVVFDPDAAGESLNAAAQFSVTGDDPGEYYLRIADQKCEAFEGTHPAPTLTIHTPSDVWLAISKGELDGAQAMMQGKYHIEGDLGLLMRFTDLFPAEGAGVEQAPASGTSSADTGPGTPLPPPMSLDTMRGMLAGMAMIFNPAAAGDPSADSDQPLKAVVQFKVTGEEPGEYYLSIADRKCAAFEDTPSEIWLAVSKGELHGTEAFIKKKYTVDGDMGLMLRFDELFPSGDGPPPPPPHPLTPTPENSIQRGPLKLGMHWLTLAFVPWIFHWFTVDIPILGAGVKIGIPFVLGVLLWAYRRVYSSSVWIETGAPIYFGIAGLVTLLGSNFFIAYGHIVANLAMCGIWMGSLGTQVPLTAQHSRWKVPTAMWTMAGFIRTNAVITAGWGVFFMLMAATALMGEYDSLHRDAWILWRNLLLIPAFALTGWFQNWYPIRLAKAGV